MGETMTMSGLPLAVVLALLFLAAVLWFRGRDMRQESGLPPGNVIYTDTGAWRANSNVLHASQYRLVGKPDYLVEQHDGAIIPVEVKSGLAPDTPWDGQVLQLAAYCLLVEANYGVRPPYGILQYKDRAFAVDFTDDLEADLLDLLDEMRATREEFDPEPDHGERRRCAACGVRDACDRRLG
jgi:CRISPR-associated exonuclease Cas4